MPPVVALAGRRVDPPDAGTPRFPPGNVGLVRGRLRLFLEDRRAAALVCSAACGADLLALEAAGALGLRRRVVLPFAPGRFRETSVVDRPGDWGPLYDRVVEAARRAGDLVVLEAAGEGAPAYAAANARILEEALALAGGAVSGGAPVPAGAALAAIVWEGRPRGPDDATQQFAELARGRGLAVEEVLTR
jgi:hypothetical protein